MASAATYLKKVIRILMLSIAGLLIVLPYASHTANRVAAQSVQQDEQHITDRQDDDMVNGFRLDQNYPNPFNPATIIRFQIPQTASVRIEVFDMIGRRIAVLADGTFQPGMHEVEFNASQLNSGIYLYRLQTGNTSLMRRMTLIK
ncbi:MAG: T9SS type A sorting domain-containing protein [Balneolaceae bacterium]